MIQYLTERKRIVLFGLLIMALTTLPYLIGYFSAGDVWEFTGFLIAVEDGNSYIAKMHSGSAGSWLFRSPYSAEKQAGALVFLPYLVLGKFASGPALHQQLVVLFHLYRILAGVLVIVAINDFLSLFLKTENRRLWAITAISLGGGLGWVITIAGMKNLLGSIPIDFLSPESFGFLSLFGLPHLALARACLFWGVTAYLSQSNGIRAGLFWLLMGFFQPMYILIIWTVCGLHAGIELVKSHRSEAIQNQQRRNASHLKKIIQAGLISSPMVIYNAAAFYFDPYLAAWTIKKDLASPHWIHYLLAYGMVLPLAVLGLKKALEDETKPGWFLASWMMLFPFLISAPVNPQRRLAEGIWVILITALFFYFENRIVMPRFGKILIGLLFPTAVFILSGAAARAADPSPPIFRPAAEVDAYLALNEIAAPGEIILTTFEVGNSLPAWAPVRVVLGHGAETVYMDRWRNEIEEYFLVNQGSMECGSFFLDNQIEYLFWGPAEVEAWDWNPGKKYCLQSVYNSSGYQIFKVE